MVHGLRGTGNQAKDSSMPTHVKSREQRSAESGTVNRESCFSDLSIVNRLPAALPHSLRKGSTFPGLPLDIAPRLRLGYPLH